MRRYFHPCVALSLVVIIGMAYNSLNAQNTDVASESIPEGQAGLWLGASYGWILDDGFKGNMFTAHVMLPKSDRRFIEFEALFYYNSRTSDVLPGLPMFGQSDARTWQIETRAKLGMTPVLTDLFVLQLLPYASIYVVSEDLTPQKANGIAQYRDNYGLGLGFELRPAFNITDRVRLFASASVPVMLFYHSRVEREDLTMPDEPQTTSGMNFDAFSGFQLTVGVQYQLKKK